jgi:hypothetical protein
MAPRKSTRKPSPDALLAEVKGFAASKTYEFEDYLPVVHELQTKGFSYADIAAFLEKKLGITVARGQVYRAYRRWLEDQQRAVEEAAEMAEREANEPPEENGDVHGLDKMLHDGAIEVLNLLEEINPKSKPPCLHEGILARASIMLERERADDQAAASSDEKLRAEKRGAGAP